VVVGKRKKTHASSNAIEGREGGSTANGTNVGGLLFKRVGGRLRRIEKSLVWIGKGSGKAARVRKNRKGGLGVSFVGCDRLSEIRDGRTDLLILE